MTVKELKELLEVVEDDDKSIIVWDHEYGEAITIRGIQKKVLKLWSDDKYDDVECYEIEIE